MAIRSIIPLTEAQNDLTGQTAAVASITTTTVPSNGTHTYLIGGYIKVNSVTLATVTLQCTFTDQASASQTLSFFGEGLTTAALSTTGFVAFPPFTIRAKPGSSITVKTIAAITTSVNYDTGGFIMRIN